MKKYNSISYIRLIAMAMILFDHLIGMRYPEFILTRVTNAAILRPLHIIQYFGALGVILFYLTSGFLYKSTSIKKTLRKIIEIFAICFVSTIAFYIFERLLWACGIDTYWSQFTILEWINGAALIGYINGMGDVINGTTWFLIPLFIYYLIATISQIFAKNKSEKKVYTTSILIMFLLLIFFIIIHLLGINVPISYYLVFVFVPLTGKGMYLLVNNKMKLSDAIISIALCYGGFLLGLYFLAHHLYFEEPYLISYAYGSLLFLVFILLEERFKRSLIVEKINRYGLSVYLVHMLWGSQLLSFAIDSLVYKCFIVPMLLVLIVYINHNYIENVIKSIGKNKKVEKKKRFKILTWRTS